MRILPCLGLLILLGAGCSSQPEATLPTATASSTTVTTTSEIAPIGLTFKTVQVANTDTLDASGKAGCEFDHAYPVIDAQVGISEEARLRINAEIAQAALQSTGLSETTSTFASLNDVLADYNETCLANLKSLKEEFKDEEMGPSMQWYDAEAFTVTINQDGLFALNFSSETYTGGAHGSHYLRSLVFDVKSGQRLKLGDIIKRDKLQDFFKQEAQALLDLNRDEDFLFEEAKEQFEALVNMTRPANEEELESSANFDGFYVTPHSIVTQYNEYEIAPYAAGQPSVELFWKDIGSYVKDDSVVKGLVK